jgi:hypothetical protein
MSKNHVLLGVAAAGLCALLTLISSPRVVSAAHGGGLDRYGCHNDKKAGNYHCHRGPCAGKTFASQAAMLADKCSKG